MWSLELLATFERPDGLKNHQWRFYGLREAGLVGTLKDPTALQLRESRGDTLELVASYQVPGGERWELAPHPSGREVALAAPDGVHLLAPESGRLLASREQLGGEPRGVLFDRSGELLWATWESAAGESNASAIEPTTGEILGVVRLGGMEQSYHTLRLHPSWGVVSVEVSCGQDGTWLTFVEARDRTFRALPGVDRPSRPFSMAGFSPAGRWFALLSPEQIELRSWPDLGQLAEVVPPSPEELFDWPATYVGERFVASTFTPEEEQYRLIVFNGELQVEATLDWDKQDQGYLFDLVGLPGDRVLVFGDQRAGLFKLKPRAR